MVYSHESFSVSGTPNTVSSHDIVVCFLPLTRVIRRQALNRALSSDLRCITIDRGRSRLSDDKPRYLDGYEPESVIAIIIIKMGPFQI